MALVGELDLKRSQGSSSSRVLCDCWLLGSKTGVRGAIQRTTTPGLLPGLTVRCCPVRGQDQGPGPGAVFLSWFHFFPDVRQLLRSLTCLWAEAGAQGLSHTFRLAPVCQAYAMVLFTLQSAETEQEDWRRSPVPASGPHRGSPGKPVTTPGRLQSATSALGWGKQVCEHVF